MLFCELSGQCINFLILNLKYLFKKNAKGALIRFVQVGYLPGDIVEMAKRYDKSNT